MTFKKLEDAYSSRNQKCDSGSSLSGLILLEIQVSFFFILQYRESNARTKCLAGKYEWPKIIFIMPI